MGLLQKLLSEYLGTFFLVLVGPGAIIINETTSGAIGHLGIAISFGGIVALMVYTFGRFSGAHINPAVTIGLTIDNKISIKDAIWYILAQLSGAITAGVILSILFKNSKTLGSTTPNGTIESLILEGIMTFILVLVIIKTVNSKENLLAPLAIGGTILVCATFGGPISGASLNPARSFGPALIANVWDAHWIYWIGPIVGATLAALMYKFIFSELNEE